MPILISRFSDIFYPNIGGKLRGSAGGGEGVLSFAPFYFPKSALTFSDFCSSRSLLANSQVLTAKSKKF